MDRRQLLIMGGIVVLGLLLAFPLTWVFTDSGGPPRQLSSLPAGPYAPIHQVDDRGVDWAINPAGGRPVAQDPNAVPAIPLIVVKTEVIRGGNDMLIGLVLTDRDGQRYQPAVAKGGVRQPAPKLRIVNEAGKVVLDDSFRYG